MVVRCSRYRRANRPRTGSHRRTDAGLQARGAVKLAEIDSRLTELTAVRDTLRAALAAGCDDLIACSESPCCPVPFATADSDDCDR
ncbi:hypothetical protein [Nocardia sp. NPDC057455]|uniref:hypothetical protein n=1 Tax=Nocardia sp. NPDC057455 TaxID=3346138 RepID=UPI003672E854